MVRRALLVSLLAGGLVGQGVPDDPVAKARALRTNPGDLPPVPRGVVEPPPLPPPETHPKDLRGAKRRMARSKGRKGKGGQGKTSSKGHARRKH
jgi:hypothetical protein